MARTPADHTAAERSAAHVSLIEAFVPRWAQGAALGQLLRNAAAVAGTHGHFAHVRGWLLCSHAVEAYWWLQLLLAAC